MTRRSRAILSYAEAKFRLENGIHGRWEDLSPEKKGLVRARIEGRLEATKRILNSLASSCDPVSDLSEAEAIINKLSPMQGDTESLRAIKEARIYIGTLFEKLEIPRSFPASAPEKKRVNSHIKKRLKEMETARHKKALEAERVGLIAEYGLPPDTTLQKARNEKERLDTIQCLGLPSDSSLAFARQMKNQEQARIQQQSDLVKRKEAAAMATEKRRRLGLDGIADMALAEKLHLELQGNLAEIQGFLYVRCWVLSSSSRWYKIGVTNDPQRREAEQNVLPVSATTIACIRMASMEHARTAERSIHKCLESHRIRGAGNKELFSLDPAHLSAVLAIIKGLESP
jgi:hypothetical protein